MAKKARRRSSARQACAKLDKPESHAEQMLNPNALLNVPMAQLAHAVWPVVAPCLPAAHWSHRLRPCVLATVPASHARHAVRPAALVKLPMSQL